MVEGAFTPSSTINGGFKSLRSFGRQALLGRWFTFFASTLIMSVSGATYMFGLYSNDVKTSLGYDQTTLNLLSFFKDLGGNVGVVAGLLNEVTPAWTVLAVGVAMNFFGYFMIWLAVVGRISRPSVWRMCLYICVGANSQTFANTGAMVTSVNNFPESRGIVIGLLKGFVGLSGAIITQLYHAFYGDHDPRSLILLIAWLPAAVSVVFLRVVRIVKNARRQADEVRVFYRMLYISLVLAGFLMALILLQIRLGFTRSEYVGGSSLVILLLLLLVVPVLKQEFDLCKINTTSTTSHENENPDGLVTSKSSHDDDDGVNNRAASCFKTVFSPPERGEDYTILQALFSVDMATIFVIVFCGVGGTLTAIDNLGQIGTALGYPKRSITTFVSLVSIWNFLGRVSSGFISEHLLAKYRFPRPLVLTAVLLLSSLGHVLIAFGVPHGLYLASVIIGFCFGAQWPLIFAIVSEIFGLKYYATLHNCGGLASPVGCYILNVLVAGRLYDREGLKQLQARGLTRGDGKDLTCQGVECYRLSFIIIALVALFGCCVSCVLVYRTRKFYKSDIYNKFRQDQGLDLVDKPKTSTIQ